MRIRPLLSAVIALAAVFPTACDVTIDVDSDHASAHERLAAFHPDAEVWARHVDVEAFDDRVVVDLELALAPDGAYRLVAEVEDADGDTDRSVSEGRYRWEGDRLVLITDHGDDGEFRRRGDDLELRTEWPVDVVLAVSGLPDPVLRRVR